MLLGVLGALVLALVSAPIVISMQNDAVARGVEAELLEFPLPAHTEVLDSSSAVGRWEGNGNGTMYLGAILIRSELPRAEIEAYYAALGEQDQKPDVEPELIRPGVTVLTDPETSRLPSLLRATFGSTASLPNHYVVHASGNAPSSWHYQFDVRGH